MSPRWKEISLGPASLRAEKYTAFILFICIVISITLSWISAKWSTSVPEVIAFGLAAFWLLRYLLTGARARLHQVLIPFGGILCWAVLQILIHSTVYAWSTWMTALYWIGNLAIFFSGLQIFRDRRIRDRFLAALASLGFIVAMVSSLQALTPNGRIFWIFPTEYAAWNPIGPFVYHNQYAAFIELILPVALYSGLTGARARFLYLLAAATMYASLFVAASRAGFILGSVELILVPAVLVRQKKLSSRSIAVTAALLAGMILTLAASAGPDRILERFSQHGQFRVRSQFNRSSLRMIEDRPRAGFGLGNWPTAYPGYAEFDDGNYANQAHNDWAQWAVEGGLPLFFIMFWIAFRTVPRALTTGWGAGVAIVFLHCWVDYPIQRPAVSVLFFSLMAALLSAADPVSRRSEGLATVTSL